MNTLSYSSYRFPPEIIQRAIWLYLRFTLSLRDVEDLLAERGITVSYETVRRWVNHFGPRIEAIRERAKRTERNTKEPLGRYNQPSDVDSICKPPGRRNSSEVRR